MKKKGIIFIVMFLILSLSVFGYKCNQEGCTDFNLEGGMGFTAYGFNIPNQATEYDYDRCDIGRSDYSPIVDDFDADLLHEIIIVDGQVISMYEKDCSLVFEQDLGLGINHNPMSINYDGDAERELVIGSGKFLYVYGYNSAVGQMVLEDTFNGSACSSSGQYWTCFEQPVDRCMSFGSSDLAIYDLATGDITCKDGEYSNTLFTDNLNFNQGLSNTRRYYNIDFVVPVCLFRYDCLTWNCGLACEYINLTGDSTATIEHWGLRGFDYEPVVAEDSKMHFYSSFTAKLGANFRIFSVFYNDGVDQSRSSIYSQGGTEIFSTQTSNSQYAYNHTSNFAVADYDKDGTNDVCFLMDGSKDENSTINFICMDSSLNELINIDVGATIPFSTGLVLGDFNSSKSTLGIGTYKGIFYIDGAVITTLYSTNETSEMENQTSLTIFTETGSSSPVIVWADDSGGFIVGNHIVSISCGNGVCDDFENMWSCPEDCNISVVPTNATGYPCINDEDCDSGKCEYGFCVLLSAGDECTSDEQCLSGSCINGKCTKASLWDRTDRLKDDSVGDDTNTNNLISLTLMLLIAGIIVVIVAKAGSGIMGAVAGGVTFFALAIFFALVGWLSPFILFGIIIFIVIIIVLAVLFSSGGD